jgi:hypothetical protein
MRYRIIYLYKGLEHFLPPCLLLCRLSRQTLQNQILAPLTRDNSSRHPIVRRLRPKLPVRQTTRERRSCAIVTST